MTHQDPSPHETPDAPTGAAGGGTDGSAVSLGGRRSDAVDGGGLPIDRSKLEATLDVIRPALQADGGDVVLVAVEDGTVKLELVGACGTCPASTVTMSAGIERILKDRVPGVQNVVAV